MSALRVYLAVATILVIVAIIGLAAGRGGLSVSQ